MVEKKQTEPSREDQIRYDALTFAIEYASNEPVDKVISTAQKFFSFLDGKESSTAKLTVVGK